MTSFIVVLDVAICQAWNIALKYLSEGADVMLKRIKDLWMFPLYWNRLISVVRQQLSRGKNRPDFFTMSDDPDTLRCVSAYQFDCDMTVQQMLRTLNEVGPWHWENRDTVWYKDDLSTVVSNRAIVRIYDEGSKYNLSYFFKSCGDQAKKEWNEINELLLKKIFPSLEAKSIERTTPHDPPAGWWRASASDGAHNNN
jgi:hypothetical protein